MSLLFDEAIASRVVVVVVSRSDGRMETLLEPAKQLKNGKIKTICVNKELT